MLLQEQLLREVWAMGREVYSALGSEQNLRDDPDDPGRKMLRQILGAVNEYERSIIVLRLRKGRAAKAALGLPTVRQLSASAPRIVPVPTRTRRPSSPGCGNSAAAGQSYGSVQGLGLQRRGPEAQARRSVALAGARVSRVLERV